jgi:hypothetical protein
VAATASCLLSLRQGRFFHDDPDVQHCSTLVTAWGGKLADTLRLNDPTREAAVAAISAVSLPVLWDKGLQSLDVVGRWCNLHLWCGPPSKWSAPGAIERERGPFTERKAGETRARRIALLEASTRSNHPTQRAAAVIRTSSAIGMYRYGATWSNILLF